MTCPRMLWLLRIALSVVFGILCLMLIALWVRSYSVLDSWQDYKFGKTWHIQSYRGRTILFTLPRLRERGYSRVTLHTRLTADKQPISGSDTRVANWGVANRICIVPCWTVAFCIAAFTFAPWINWFKRFSLRTLLLTMTLVAVVLGLGVAMR
jgi:hypothetical protein